MEYQGNDNHGRSKSEYIEKIKAITDDELFEETKDKIWLSAYASNNPRSDYHWQSDACYDEAGRRGKPKIYERAYRVNLKNI